MKRTAPLPALPRPRPEFKPNAPNVISWPLTDPDALPQTHGSNHRHWGILAYYDIDANGNFTDTSQIEVEAENEPEAIARAQLIITRANYRVSWVKEICTKDAALKEE
jgi:hypothetical protein